MVGSEVNLWPGRKIGKTYEVKNSADSIRIFSSSYLHFPNSCRNRIQNGLQVVEMVFKVTL